MLATEGDSEGTTETASVDKKSDNSGARPRPRPTEKQHEVGNDILSPVREIISFYDLKNRSSKS